MARLRRISIDNPARSRGWKIVVISQGWEGSVLYLLIGWERERKRDFERESSNRRTKNERRTWRDGWKRVSKRRLRRIVESRATANGRRIPMKFKCRRRVFRGGQGKKVGRSKRAGNGDGRRGCWALRRGRGGKEDRLKEGETERRKAWWWRRWWWCRSATQALSLADLHVSVLNYPVPTAPVTLFSLRNSSWTPNTI